MNGRTIREWLESAAAAIHEQRDFLTQLDAAIGDADHGTNMDRGFAAVLAKLEAEDAPPRRVASHVRRLHARLHRRRGERALWGIRRAGRALGDGDEFDAESLAAALDAALAGVVELGAAAEGEKTMVDALAPAARALRERLDAGDDLGAPAAARHASEEGMRATVPLQAFKGRAPISASAASATRIPGRRPRH